MGYKKDKETGVVRWDGIQNINFKLYWTASCYNDVIKSFNINTNDWVARYIFKRCRWMGSRHASHFTTLMFLAIWHGYHWCYFHMFAYEFMVRLISNNQKPTLEFSWWMLKELFTVSQANQKLFNLSHPGKYNCWKNLNFLQKMFFSLLSR